MENYVSRKDTGKKGALPVGLAARNPLWPEARWNLTGLFVHDWLILQVFSLLRERFGCRLSFDGIHGAPQVPWNCGRVVAVPMPTPEALQTMVRTFNDVGIGVYFTFSNHLLEKSDLEHPACNMLLESIDNGRGVNGVILASELLYDYVRQRHPELKLTASIVKVTKEEGRGDLAYYRSVQERFDSVMLHPDDGFEYDLLDQLDRDKIEILVNENCAYRCPNRGEDYDQMGSASKAGRDPRTVVRPPGCRIPLGTLTPVARSCNFTTAEMQRVYQMGYRRFKLQGRQDMPATFLFDLLRFAVEPELAAPIIFKAFVSGQARRQAGEAVEKVRAAYREAKAAGISFPAGGAARPSDSPAVRPMVVETPAMDGHGLPTGEMARHPLWPDARWRVDGLSVHGQVLRDVLAMLVDRFECRLNIDSVCGGLEVSWNGLPPSKESRLNFDALAETVGRFNDLDVGVFCLFDSPELAPTDLADKTGNRVLEILDNGRALNGCILASELLAEHIRSQHPGLKLTASVVKSRAEGGQGQADHYRALTERFDRVMLCPEDGFDDELLAQLDRDRIELVVNEDSAWDGSAAPITTLAADLRSCNFTAAELKRVYDLGYRRFRLRNPSSSPNVFLYDVLRYTLEPNLLLPVVFKSFTSIRANLHRRLGA
jgi:hypothetical protein